MSETLLSNATLGIERKGYSKDRIHDKKVEGPLEVPKSRKYRLEWGPVKPWFSKKMVNFTLGISRETVDPEWFKCLLPAYINASLWLNIKKDLYTLRVPYEYSYNAKCILWGKKLRFDTKTYTWIRRRQYKVGSRNSAFI